jgi:hypothetical protein
VKKKIIKNCISRLLFQRHVDELISRNPWHKNVPFFARFQKKKKRFYRCQEKGKLILGRRIKKWLVGNITDKNHFHPDNSGTVAIQVKDSKSYDAIKNRKRLVADT